MCELPRPCLQSQSCTCKASMISEGSYSASFIIDEEFEIEEGSTTAWESRQDLFPASLVLVAMRELDVYVLEGD